MWSLLFWTIFPTSVCSRTSGVVHFWMVRAVFLTEETFFFFLEYSYKNLPGWSGCGSCWILVFLWVTNLFNKQTNFKIIIIFCYGVQSVFFSVEKLSYLVGYLFKSFYCFNVIVNLKLTLSCHFFHVLLYWHTVQYFSIKVGVRRNIFDFELILSDMLTSYAAGVLTGEQQDLGVKPLFFSADISWYH